MKGLLALAVLFLALSGCVPATAILASSTASDVLEMKKVNCMTQYGFMPEFEYGWVDDVDPMHQTPTKRSALTRAYVKRVSRDSHAGRNGIAPGDDILKINDREIFVGETALNTIIGMDGAEFTRMTLRNKAGEIYSVDFGAGAVRSAQ